MLWSEEQRLVVNKFKCNALVVGLQGPCPRVPLSGVSFVTNLKIRCVVLNSDLNWNNHCDFLVKNASRRLYVLRLLRKVTSRDVLCRVYNAILRSFLEYPAPLFIGLSHVNSRKLERIQQRFHRLLCG